MMFFSVNIFLDIRIAPIFTNYSSKDKFSGLDGTLIEAFFEILISFCYDPKTKVEISKIAPNDY